MPSIGGKIVPRGKGWYNTGTTVDDKYYDSTQSDYVGCPSEKLEGSVVTFKPRTKSTRVSQDSGGDVTMVLVRNTSSIALLPKMAVRWEAAAYGRRVDGYAFQAANTGPGEVAGIVDEFWPSGGVPIGEVFWLVVGGRTLVTTTAEAATGVGEFAVGGKVVAATAAASTGATTEGRVQEQNTTVVLTAVTAEAFASQIQNAIGRAMSAKTSAETNEDLLINCSIGGPW